jgi:hypothetical protein
VRAKKVHDKDLDQLIEFTTMDRAGVLEAVGATAEAVEMGYSYQSMGGLCVLESPKHRDTRFFFNGDAVVMVALAEPSIDANELRQRMGDGVVELRSRQGKRSMIEVDAAIGLAFSSDDDDVGFVEVFPPTTADDYRARIWFEPPAFRK